MGVVGVVAAGARLYPAVSTAAAGQHHHQTGEHSDAENAGDEIAGHQPPPRLGVLARLGRDPFRPEALLVLSSTRHRAVNLAELPQSGLSRLAAPGMLPDLVEEKGKLIVQ